MTQSKDYNRSLTPAGAFDVFVCTAAIFLARKLQQQQQQQQQQFIFTLFKKNTYIYRQIYITYRDTGLQK